MSEESKKSFQAVALKKLQLAVRALPLDRQHIEDHLNIVELNGSLDFREYMFTRLTMEVSAVQARQAPRNTDRLVDLMDTLLQSEMQAGDAHELARVLDGLPEFLRGLDLGGHAKYVQDVLADLRGRKDEKSVVQENPIWGR